jgi:predicted CopG family antitoxin
MVYQAGKTTIQISNSLREKLVELKRGDDTYETVIFRLVKLSEQKPQVQPQVQVQTIAVTNQDQKVV